MTSLLDIGPLTEEVEVRGKMLTVQGLTAGHVFQLFAEFPDMRKMLDGKQGSPQEVFLNLAPDLLAKIITMALGEHGNKEVEERAKQLGADDQLIILSAVQRLSFRDGIGPFVERISRLMQPPQASTPSLGSSSKTPESQPAFSASLQTDSPPSLRGHARRVN